MPLNRVAFFFTDGLRERIPSETDDSQTSNSFCLIIKSHHRKGKNLPQGAGSHPRYGNTPLQIAGNNSRYGDASLQL